MYIRGARFVQAACIYVHIYQAESIVDEQWRKRRSITNSRWKI